MVGNLNVRLRNYFFLRRQLGQGYLDLLRFLLTDVTHGRERGMTGASKLALTREREMRSLLRLSKQALTLQS